MTTGGWLREARDRDIYVRYLAGEPIANIADYYEMNRTYIYFVLRNRFGVSARTRQREVTARRRAEAAARPRICKMCGQDYAPEGWHRHLIRANHGPAGGRAANYILYQELADAYGGGQRIESICAQFGVTQPMIYRALRWAGTPLRRPHVFRKGKSKLESQAIAEIIREGIRKGLNDRQAGALAGVSAQRANQIRAAHGG